MIRFRRLTSAQFFFCESQLHSCLCVQGKTGIETTMETEANPEGAHVEPVDEKAESSAGSSTVDDDDDGDEEDEKDVPNMFAIDLDMGKRIAHKPVALYGALNS